MSTIHDQGGTVDVGGKSSVTLAKNSKGETQQSVKVYDGVDEIELARITELAISTYRVLQGEA